MKKKTTSSRKRLSVNKSTLRHLRPDQLRRIDGGNKEYTLTLVTCTNQDDS